MTKRGRPKRVLDTHTDVKVDPWHRYLVPFLAQHFDLPLQRDLGIVRHGNRPHRALYDTRRDAWVLTCRDWLLGAVTRHDAFLNVMDNHVTLSIIGSEYRALPQRGPLRYAGGLDSTWLSTYTVVDYKFPDASDVYQRRIPLHVEELLLELAERNGLRIYGYGKNSGMRTFYVDAAVPKSVGRVSRGLIFRRSDAEHFPAEPRRVLLIHEKDIYLHSLGDSSTHRLTLTLAGIQRLSECETADEFFGALNTNLRFDLSREAALKTYERMRAAVQAHRLTGMDMVKALQQLKTGAFQ